MDNLSNLNPSSCILANARKLTNVEIHSTELYNINVTNNFFLRSINLEGCSTLGTVTATGSSLDLSNCKYLRYCNVYNTALTEVQLNTSGGSLTEIYYPSTLQSLTLIKQRLLEKVGLPYGTNGREVPTALYTVDIEECPRLRILNTSDDPSINTSFASIYYCNNLTLRNALDLEELRFDGFHRLKNVTIENMFNLTTVGFNNLLPVGNASTLKYVGFSNCPLLGEIELNCTSDDYEIAFDTNSVLNFGGLNALKTISSNCVIKGLDTIVLPLELKNMFFTNEYGTGYSDIKNLWSSAVCNVTINGSVVECIHVIDGYEGIDFANMNLKNIDLGALVNIPDAINFSLSPTTVNPHFNLNRDGVTYPYLQPSGTLDLSNYTESLAKFFDGVDLRKLQLICNNPLPQRDLSYCFYNSTFDKDSQVSAVLNNIDTVNNMEYCFYRTSVKDVSILNSINFLAGTSLAYCFAECPNISKLENITLSGNIGNASYMFSGSGISTINNVSTSCGNIVGMFSNCDNLVTVTNFDANGTTSYESLFEGCSGMSVAPVTVIPATITSIRNMYKNCDGLISIDGFVLHGNITEATGFIEGCDNLINANNVTISGKFYNDIFRGLTSLKYVNNLLINYVGRSMTFAHMFEGCSNLVEMSFHDDSYVKDVISMDYMFAGTSMRTVDFSNVNFEKITSIKYMFANCLMEEFSYTVPITIISLQGFLSGCRNLRTLRNFIVPTNVNTLNWLDDTNVENLIDCSFNTQYTTFTDNTSIRVVENLEYTGTDFSSYFSGCTSLERVSLTLNNTVTRAENTFENCPNLAQIDFADSDLSNVTSINGMFNGDTSLTTINNLKITKNSTTADNTTLVGCPISNTDGLFINSNNALNMFRLGAESAITAVTDFELGSNANDLSQLFMDNPNITHDIVIPSHVHTVEKMYYNCPNLTYVNSNWSNVYDLNIDTNPNNDVVTANCYGECDNIQYIDNELYMNEYGELTAMYSIPEEWGGILNCSTNQTAFYVNSDLLTEYTITLNGSDGVYTTEWGDGTTDKRCTHTYSKSGSFRIVTNNSETFGTGSQIPDNFRTAITRVLHLDENITNGSHLFDGCTNLLEIKQLTNSFVNGDYMFNGCSNLLDINGGITISSGTTMAYMCNGCAKFTKTPISTIPDTCTNISYLFANSGITDISGMTFGSGISTYEFWRLGTPITIANNLTIKCSQPLFQGCTTLISIDNLTVSSNVRDITSWFEGCTKLSEDFLIPSHVTNCTNTFKGCSSMTHAHSNWDDTYTNGITATDCYSGCTEITHIDDVDIGKSEYVNGLDDIPPAWGGYGFYSELTGIYVFEIPSDNYTLTLETQWNKNGLIGDGMVAWGDGTSTANVTSHTYATAGRYAVKIHGYPSANNYCHNSIAESLIEVVKMPYRDYNITYLFNNCSKLKKLNMSNITGQLSYWLINCNSLTEIIAYNVTLKGSSSPFQSCYYLERIEGLNTWDTSQVTTMSSFFSGCSSLTEIDVSSFDTSNVNTMEAMFRNYGLGVPNSKLKRIKGIENFDTSKVTKMNLMFQGHGLLESLDLSGWDVSKVTNMNATFGDCGKLVNLKLPTHLSCSNFDEMFKNCTSLVDLSAYTFEDTTGANDSENGSGNGMSGMFNGCRSLKYIGTLINRGALRSAFADCTNLISITEFSFRNYELGNHTDSYMIFKNCTSLTSVNFTGITPRGFTGTSSNNTFHHTKFDHDSLLSLFNCLNPDGAVNTRIGSAQYPLRFRPEVIARMSDDEIAIATSKGWTIG